MNKKQFYLTIGCAVFFLLTSSLSIFLWLENKKLNSRVESFIPVAIDLENENNLKAATILQQQKLLDSLYTIVDSYQHKKTEPLNSPQLLTPGIQENQILEHPPTQENSFKDLNKGIR